MIDLGFRVACEIVEALTLITRTLTHGDGNRYQLRPGVQQTWRMYLVTPDMIRLLRCRALLIDARDTGSRVCLPYCGCLPIFI
jgi:hypothetical protein